VTISVTRNERAPIFSLPSYTQTIPDTFSLGQMILDVTATDADNDIVKYEITGGSRALEFYYINPDTGSISLKKPLTEGTQSQDTVRFFSFCVCPLAGYRCLGLAVSYEIIFRLFFFY
jgi:hypothetical protein